MRPDVPIATYVRPSTPTESLVVAIHENHGFDASLWHGGAKVAILSGFSGGYGVDYAVRSVVQETRDAIRKYAIDSGSTLRVRMRHRVEHEHRGWPSRRVETVREKHVHDFFADLPELRTVSMAVTTRYLFDERFSPPNLEEVSERLTIRHDFQMPERLLWRGYGYSGPIRRFQAGFDAGGERAILTVRGHVAFVVPLDHSESDLRRLERALNVWIDVPGHAGRIIHLDHQDRPIRLEDEEEIDPVHVSEFQDIRRAVEEAIRAVR